MTLFSLLEPDWQRAGLELLKFRGPCCAYVISFKFCVHREMRKREFSGQWGCGSYAAAAAKSLQSCPTLCDPIDGRPPGSLVPGILQARTLEGVAISFSNAWKWKVKVKSLSRVRLFATPWTAAYQVPPSMGFSRQEYWSGVPLPSLWELYCWLKESGPFRNILALSWQVSNKKCLAALRNCWLEKFQLECLAAICSKELRHFLEMRIYFKLSS